MSRSAAKLPNGESVGLYENGILFGTISHTGKSEHFINDIIDNWEDGTIKYDNQHIIKADKVGSNEG